MFDQTNPDETAAAEPPQKNPNPAQEHTEIHQPEIHLPEIDQPQTGEPAPAEPEADEPKPKRNCGRTGPTSQAGRDTSSRNATTHSMCSETLILAGETQEDWDNLLTNWLTDYQNPAENTVLHTFVVKTAQAEWFRLRTQKQYNFFLKHHTTALPYSWPAELVKQNDLMMRYVTTAERRFQREYRLLEHHSKAHRPAPDKEAKPAAEPPPEPDRPEPRLIFVNNDTGESMDVHGNLFPPPPDYKFEPIKPGVYGPDHPAYPGRTRPDLGKRRR